MIATASGGAALAQPDVRDHRKDRDDKPRPDRPAPNKPDTPAPAPAPAPAPTPTPTPTPGPDVRDHRDRDDKRPRPPAGDEPTEAPPAARDESPGTKPGYVWVGGRWQWKAGTWDWVAGHWERERKGKQWRGGAWERDGDRWRFRDGSWADVTDDAGGPGPRGDDRPRQAPPAPRDESPGAKAGHVWVRGQWDWKGGQWDWAAGHWERERPGKRWREPRWEQRDDHWERVDGDWIEAGADGSVVVTNDGGPRRPPREWKLERPVISSFWPPKGKPGGRIVVRGRNFPTNAQVTWGGQVIRAVKITPTQITIAVPDDATTGVIALQVGGRRPLPVGRFEVAEAYDADAEARRLEDDRRRTAEAAWAAREKKRAKDRAAREAAWRTQRDERLANRDERRRERAEAIRSRWDRAFLADEETQAELTLHAQRTAELSRMDEVAEIAGNAKLGVRIGVARDEEDARHADRMSALRDSFEGK